MNITDGAKQMLEGIFQERNVGNIRLYGISGGCCGSQVGLSLDPPQESDEIQIINGIQVALDPEIKLVVAEVTLDKQDSPEGSGFVLIGAGGCC